MAASSKGATIAEATYPAHIDAKHFGSPHKLLDHLHHFFICAQAPNKIVKRDIGFLPFQSIKGFCGVSPPCCDSVVSRDALVLCFLPCTTTRSTPHRWAVLGRYLIVMAHEHDHPVWPYDHGHIIS